jgi:formamidopyrimidine-DNA glycosylase
MPELPEVETVRRALVPALNDRQVVRAFVGRPDLRWQLPLNLAETLTGQTFGMPQRRGKFLLLPLLSDQTLLMHLGMSGSVRIHDAPPLLAKHDHFMLEMAPVPGATDPASMDSAFIVFNDPRRFGWIDLFAGDIHPMLGDMGPEPLGNEFSDAYLASALANRSGPIKTTLLNQQIVAGIGNIYACEALFYAGISPRRKSSTVQGKRAQRLVESITRVLQRAIAEGGTSLRDHVQPGGEIGYFVQQLAVYGRAGKACPHCTTPIRTITQSGRSTFFCSTCQR